MSVRVTAALVACLLLVGACSDEGPDRAAYVEAVRTDLLSSDEVEELPLDDDEATCVAEAVVDAAGVERLDDAGVTPQDFAAAEFEELDVGADPDQLRDDLAGSLEECSLGAPLIAVMVAEFPFELDDADEACIADALDDSPELATGVAAVLVDGDERALTGALTTGLAACPSVVGDLLADRITGAGFTVDDAARACINAQIAERGPEAIEQILGPEATRLGAEIADVCLAG